MYPYPVRLSVSVVSHPMSISTRQSPRVTGQRDSSYNSDQAQHTQEATAQRCSFLTTQGKCTETEQQERPRPVKRNETKPPAQTRTLRRTDRVRNPTEIRGKNETEQNLAQNQHARTDKGRDTKKKNIPRSSCRPCRTVWNRPTSLGPGRSCTVRSLPPFH